MKNALKNELARDLYLNSKLNQKQIALQVGVTEKTMTSWIAKGEWEKLKEMRTITRAELLNQTLRILKSRNDQIENIDPGDFKNLKILTDSQAVLIKQLELLSDNPLHVYIGVLDEFLDWLSRTHPENLRDITTVSFEFIEHLNKSRK